MNEETTAPQPAENAAKPAKARGILLLKLWGGAYGLVIIAYIAFLAGGSRTVSQPDLKAGDRLWKNEVFEYNGERIELHAGDTVSPALLKTMKNAYPADSTLMVYKEDSFYHLPFPHIMGVLNFLGLALVLYTLGGDALPEYLTNHCRTVETELAEARAARAEAEELKRKRAAMEEELKAEEERLMAAAKDEARQEHEYLLKHRKEESERFLSALENHLGAEIHAAAEALKCDAANRAVAQARALLEEKADTALQQQLVKDFTQDLKEASPS